MISGIISTNMQKPTRCLTSRRHGRNLVRRCDVLSIPSTSGIYKIVCVPTGKVYIGSAVNILHRCQTHRSALRSNTHPNQYLQRAWNKYGEQSFDFLVVELILSPFLVEREQYWIDRLRCSDTRRGFNLSPTAGSSLGVKHSAESRQKWSDMRRGKKRRSPSPESIRARSMLLTGRRHSEETRKKMSESHKGLPRSEEHRRNLSISLKGRIVTEETRQRIREANTGRRQSEEEKAKRRQSMANSEAVRAAHMKQWVITDPDGTTYIVTGLSPFCREHGLRREAMRDVANGKIADHCGWTCRRG